MRGQKEPPPPPQRQRTSVAGLCKGEHLAKEMMNMLPLLKIYITKLFSEQEMKIDTSWETASNIV